MYDLVCRDHVIGALTWLQEHNDYYKDVIINDEWCNMIPDDQLHDTIIEHSTSNTSMMNELEILKSTKSNISTTSKNETGISEVQSTSNILSNKDILNEPEDTELVEDQAAINQKQNLIGDALPSLIIWKIIYSNVHLEKITYQSMYYFDNDFEVLAFSDLFPYGSCGYNSTERSVKLPIHKFFQQQLLNVDVRFAKNIEYLFCAQHITDLRHIQNEANLAVRLSRGRTLGGSKVTAGLLCNELHDVLAMLHSLGLPTWFLTLSVADLHWPKMIQAVAMQFEQKLSHKDVLNMSIQEISNYLQQSSVTGMYMFQH